jgi:hypothetical protein
MRQGSGSSPTKLSVKVDVNKHRSHGICSKKIPRTADSSDVRPAFYYVYGMEVVGIDDTTTTKAA